MSVTLFLGLRLSRRPYERIGHKLSEDSFSTCTVGDLKKFIVEELLKNYCNRAGVELVYCGFVLDDSAKLKTEGIKPGCTIHVFEKDNESESDTVPLSEDTIKCAVVAYRRISSFCGNRFPKIIYPEVLSKILGKYPEFYNDLGAFAILRDAVLLEKMVRSRHASSIGEQYPVLINAAVFIADTIISHLKTNISLQSSSADISDVEMSEDSSSQEYVEDQRVSRGQLAAALLSARSASNSSQTASFGPSSSIQSSDNSQEYVAELQTMREMGLTEENSNRQALVLCNGNVEEAVNLVLGIRHFF